MEEEDASITIHVENGQNGERRMDIFIGRNDAVCILFHILFSSLNGKG